MLDQNRNVLWYICEQVQNIQNPIKIETENVVVVFMACTRLHSFCVNKPGAFIRVDDGLAAEELSSRYFHSDPIVARVQVMSTTRHLLVLEMASKEMTRPNYNVNRKKYNDNFS